MSFGKKKIRKHTFAWQMGLDLGTWQWCQVIPHTFAQQMGFIWNKKLKQTSKRLGLNLILKKKKKRREVENRLAVTAWDCSESLDRWWMLGPMVRAWVGDEIESEWELGSAVVNAWTGNERLKAWAGGVWAVVLKSEWDCVTLRVSKTV